MGLTGCLRFSTDGDDGSSVSSTLTATGTATATETPTDDPTETATEMPPQATADFSFSYAPHGGDGNGAVRITYDGGDPLVAEQLQILSSDGDRARWHELSSTSTQAIERVTTGETAVVSGNVVNWNSDITAGEEISVVYHYSDGSATELASFTDTGTPTRTQSETPTQTQSGTGCTVEVDTTTTVGAGENKIYTLDIERESKVKITILTQDGELPVLSVVSPSGDDIIGRRNAEIIREEFTTTESGSHIFKLDNNAWLSGDVGTWKIQIEVCNE